MRTSQQPTESTGRIVCSVQLNKPTRAILKKYAKSHGVGMGKALEMVVKQYGSVPLTFDPEVKKPTLSNNASHYTHPLETRKPGVRRTFYAVPLYLKESTLEKLDAIAEKSTARLAKKGINIRVKRSAVARAIIHESL